MYVNFIEDVEKELINVTLRDGEFQLEGQAVQLSKPRGHPLTELYQLLAEREEFGYPLRMALHQVMKNLLTSLIVLERAMLTTNIESINVDATTLKVYFDDLRLLEVPPPKNGREHDPLSYLKAK
jgi:hypothetical protein